MKKKKDIPERCYLVCLALARFTSSFHFSLHISVSPRTSFLSSSPRHGSAIKLLLNSFKWVTFSWYKGASLIISWKIRKKKTFRILRWQQCFLTCVTGKLNPFAKNICKTVLKQTAMIAVIFCDSFKFLYLQLLKAISSWANDLTSFDLQATRVETKEVGTYTWSIDSMYIYN